MNSAKFDIDEVVGIHQTVYDVYFSQVSTLNDGIKTDRIYFKSLTLLYERLTRLEVALSELLTLATS